MSAQQDYLNSRQCTGHMTSDMIMNYCRDWLRGMLHTTELDLVVGFAPESFFKQIWSPWLPPVWCPPWYDIHRGVWLSSGMHTAETDSLVWCTPQRLTPWCDAHHRDWLRGMMHSAHCGVWLRGMHTAEILNNLKIFANSSKNNSKKL